MTGDPAGNDLDVSYRLLPGAQVGKLGSNHYLFDESGAQNPIISIPTQQIREMVYRLIRTIRDAMPRGLAWPLPRIVDLFEAPAERASIPALVKSGYLEPVDPPNGGAGTPAGSMAITAGGLPGTPTGGTAVESGGLLEPLSSTATQGAPPEGALGAEAAKGLADPRATVGFDEQNRRHFFREASFFNLPKTVDSADADVGIFGVPFCSVPHSLGAELGPAFLRGLSQRAGLWQRIHDDGLYTELALEDGLPVVLGKGIVLKDFGDVGDGVRTIDDLMRRMHEIVDGIVIGQSVRPLFVGGDHAVTFPIVHAFLKRYPDLALIHLDAHNDLFYSDTVCFSHAAVVSNLLVYSGLQSVHSFGLRTYFDNRVGNVNAIAQHPADLRDRIHLHPISHLRRLLSDPSALSKVLRGIGGRPCYLTVDLDVLSPGEIGGRLSTPAGPGLLWDELLETIWHISRELDVVGADIVELNVASGDRRQENPLNPAFLTLLLIQCLADSAKR